MTDPHHHQHMHHQAQLHHEEMHHPQEHPEDHEEDPLALTLEGDSMMHKRKAQDYPMQDQQNKDLMAKKPRKKYTYPKKWQCTEPGCDKAFSSQANLLRHTFSHSDKKEVQCEWPGCTLMFKRQDKMREHYERHRQPNGLRRGRKSTKIWRCNIGDCEEVFQDPKLLNLHLATHSGAPTFVCFYPGCGKSFATELRFKVHFEMHFAGEVPCKECGRVFTSKARLARHMLTHTGEKNFKCEYEGCNKSFARKDKLVDHIRVHTGEKPFKCPYEECGKAFSDYSSRRTHIQMHQRDSQGIPTKQQQVTNLYRNSVTVPQPMRAQGVQNAGVMPVVAVVHTGHPHSHPGHMGQNEQQQHYHQPNLGDLANLANNSDQHVH